MTTVTFLFITLLFSIPQISLFEQIIEKNVLPVLLGNSEKTAAAQPTAKSADIEHNQNVEETETFEQIYQFSPQGKIAVSNVNGSIEVDTWERNEVKLQYVKTADTKEALREIEIRINAAADSIDVETDMNRSRKNWGGGKSYRKMEVNYRLTVPRGALVDEVETVNGSIRVLNLKNFTKVSTVNGRIDALNLAGKISLSTVNGEINADFDTLQNTSTISLEAVNGETVLVIPSDSDATIKAETVNGSIANDFNIPIRKGKYVGRDLFGQIGSGAVRINLETVNGTVSVRRKNDGKTIKNPVSLLVDEKDGEDEDRAILARDAQTAARERQRALRDAQREQRKNQVRINKSTKIKREIEEEVADSLADVAADIALRSVDIAAQAVAAVDLRGDLPDGSPLTTLNRKSETFSVGERPKVSVESRNCLVVVRGWNKNEVSYTADQVSASGDSLPMEIKTEKRGTAEIRIRAVDNSPAKKKASSVLQIFVPRNSNIQIASDSEIRVEGVSGEFDLKGANEPITLRDAQGKLKASTTEGVIRVLGFDGEIDSATETGAMNFEGSFKNLSAVSEGGNIILTLPDNASALIDSGTAIKTLGFDTIKNEGSEMWRIGSGGTTIYKLQTDGGEVIVRKLSTLRSN